MFCSSYLQYRQKTSPESYKSEDKIHAYPELGNQPGPEAYTDCDQMTKLLWKSDF